MSGLIAVKNLSMHNYHLLIPCGGSGQRFGGSVPKQYLPLLGKTVLDWTLHAFLELGFSNINIVHANNDSYIEQYKQNYPQVNFLPLADDTRAGTVRNGLESLKIVSNNDWVLVHDAARCVIDKQDVQNLIETLDTEDVGGILAARVVDTIKQVESNTLIIEKTINRDVVYLAQTPQMFRYNILYKALNSAEMAEVTDEASAVEQFGLAVKIVVAQSVNLKITYPDDLELASFILQKRIKK